MRAGRQEDGFARRFSSLISDFHRLHEPTRASHKHTPDFALPPHADAPILIAFESSDVTLLNACWAEFQASAYNLHSHDSSRMTFWLNITAAWSDVALFA
jgi:hypothetical protein